MLLKKANAWDFIQAFPEGLNTLVGERGIKLSGGTKAAYCYCKGNIKKILPFFLLDEATSSLDAESELLVSTGIG